MGKQFSKKILNKHKGFRIRRATQKSQSSISQNHPFYCLVQCSRFSSFEFVTFKLFSLLIYIFVKIKCENLFAFRFSDILWNKVTTINIYSWLFHDTYCCIKVKLKHLFTILFGPEALNMKHVCKMLLQPANSFQYPPG